MTEHRPLNIAPLPVKLRVDDYLLLDSEGAFEEYRKTELIGGKVYYMNAQHRPHARVKSRLYALLANALPTPLEALVEASINIPPVNVPEPDIVVTTEPEGDGLVPLASVRLIVEVADATLKQDRSTKAAIYAEAGVPEYWIADVNGRTFTQLWSPSGAEYGERADHPFGATLRATTIDGLEIDTTRL